MKGEQGKTRTSNWLGLATVDGSGSVFRRGAEARAPGSLRLAVGAAVQGPGGGGGGA